MDCGSSCLAMIAKHYGLQSNIVNITFCPLLFSCWYLVSRLFSMLLMFQRVDLPLLISCKIANFACEGQLLKTIYICNESTHHGSYGTIGV